MGPPAPKCQEPPTIPCEINQTIVLTYLDMVRIDFVFRQYVERAEVCPPSKDSIASRVVPENEKSSVSVHRIQYLVFLPNTVSAPALN